MKKGLFPIISLLLLTLLFPGTAAADLLPGTPVDFPLVFSVDLTRFVC